MTSRYSIVVLLVVAAVLGGATVPAQAHWADLSVAEIVVGETRTEMTLVFPTGLVSEVDDNRDGQLSDVEVRAHAQRLRVIMREKIHLIDGDRRGALSVEPVENAPSPKGLSVAPGTHSTLRLVYTWPQPIRTLTIRYRLFLPGVSTASCLATILQGGQVRTFVFRPEAQDYTMVLGHRAARQEAWSFVVLGIEHIWTGYDHILFLLSLLMLGGGLKYLIKVVSAFTVAHSITLTLAVLNIVTLPPRLVESAIALSIVYVAVENLVRRDQVLRSRWMVTFAFGLVHGLGLASVLKEIAIPRSNLALSLASFNLGVELGQIAIVAAAFVLLQMLRSWPREVLVRRLVSAAAAAAGLIWFIQRVFLSL